GLRAVATRRAIQSRTHSSVPPIARDAYPGDTAAAVNPYDPVETYVAAILLLASQKEASHIRIEPTDDGKADISLFIGGKWWPEDRDLDFPEVMRVLAKQMGLPPPLRGKAHAGRVALQRDDDSVLCYLVAIEHRDDGSFGALVEVVDEPTFRKRDKPIAP